MKALPFALLLALLSLACASAPAVTEQDAATKLVPEPRAMLFAALTSHVPSACEQGCTDIECFLACIDNSAPETPYAEVPVIVPLACHDPNTGMWTPDCFPEAGDRLEWPDGAAIEPQEPTVTLCEAAGEIRAAQVIAGDLPKWPLAVSAAARATLRLIAPDAVILLTPQQSAVLRIAVQEELERLAAESLNEEDRDLPSLDALQISQSLLADVDGDGQKDLLVSAHISIDEWPVPRVSGLFLIRAANPHSAEVLASSNLEYFRVSALSDLNHDQAEEVTVEVYYYEGWGISLLLYREEGWLWMSGWFCGA